MPDAALLSDLGPLGILCLAVLLALPPAVKATMGIADAMARGRLELASQPFEILKTSLEVNSKQFEYMERMTREFTVMKVSFDTLSHLVEDLISHLKKD